MANPTKTTQPETSLVIDADSDTAYEEAFDDLWSPQQHDQHKVGVEDMLLDEGLIDASQAAQAMALHKETPRKHIGQILIDMGVASETDVQRCMATQLDLPFDPLDEGNLVAKVTNMLPPDYIKKNQVIPVRVSDGRLVLGMVDPANVFLLEEIRRMLKRPVDPVVVAQCDILRVIEGSDEQDNAEARIDDIIKNIEDDDVEIVEIGQQEIADLERVAGESPVIRFVNYLIFNAVRDGASDIHIEPSDDRLRIRYRIDGVLFETMSPPYSMHAAIVSRLKIMSNLDISERRLPQDGRIRAMVHGRNVDLRISTLPVTAGEKCVIRILDNRSILVGLEKLGFAADMLEIFSRQISRPHGIVLVTGPTGSGKTTTLYSALKTMDGNSLNISTVEDPVEYQLGFCNQVNINERIGFSFPIALRAMLRQDPDVIMIGEIRDPETAHIAVQASLTGHLVLSTLHTNDAPSTITRLINIGVEPYLISASVNTVVSQRLVRTICGNCKERFQPSDEQHQFLELQGISPTQIWHGKGCDRCRQTGYMGRCGIYEMLLLDDVFRDVITGKPDITNLRKLCKERGMISMREDGYKKVVSGSTTIEEILRVTEEAT